MTSPQKWASTCRMTCEADRSGARGPGIGCAPGGCGNLNGVVSSAVAVALSGSGRTLERLVGRGQSRPMMAAAGRRTLDTGFLGRCESGQLRSHVPVRSPRFARNLPVSLNSCAAQRMSYCQVKNRSPETSRSSLWCFQTWRATSMGFARPPCATTASSTQSWRSFFVATDEASHVSAISATDDSEAFPMHHLKRHPDWSSA